MKKFLLFTLSFFFAANIAFAQQNYDDFENNKFQFFGKRNGTLDSAAFNPLSDAVNSSALCAKYDRADSVQYDNIKIYPNKKLEDVTPYANNLGNPPKIKMKVFTAAPLGTPVKIQLGIKSDDNFPTGVHSEYQAYTTVQNAWEELTFDFLQKPIGSLTGPTEVNKIILFFYPFSLNGDTYYFDDLTGPNLISPITVINTASLDNSPELLHQNIPNPSKDNTIINYTLNSMDVVSLKLYNILGEEVLTLVDQKKTIGKYSVSVNTTDFAEGIYFYILKTGEHIETKRMVVSKN